MTSYLAGELNRLYHYLDVDVLFNLFVCVCILFTVFFFNHAAFSFPHIDFFIVLSFILPQLLNLRIRLRLLFNEEAVLVFGDYGGESFEMLDVSRWS